MMNGVAKRALNNSLFGMVVGAQQLSIYHTGGLEHLPEPLTHTDEHRVLLCKNQGDVRARNTLVEHNLRLVVYIARKYISPSVHIEDLISVGTIGLIKAVDTFQFGRNAKLATYASRCIENEILMMLRRINRLRMDISFDEPVTVDRDGNALFFSDVFSVDGDLPSCCLDHAEECRMLHKAVRRLCPKAQRIINLRYGLCDGVSHTQKETAGVMGVSQSYISRLEKRILKQLHIFLLADFLC